jgi:hypothetical protein
MALHRRTRPDDGKKEAGIVKLLGVPLLLLVADLVVVLE